jgi:hypothetical protein
MREEKVMGKNRRDRQKWRGEVKRKKKTKEENKGRASMTSHWRGEMNTTVTCGLLGTSNPETALNKADQLHLLVIKD